MKATDIATKMQVRLLGMNLAFIPTKIVDLPVSGESAIDRMPTTDEDFKFVVTHVAESLFAISNSPFSTDEELSVWGTNRSLSVGDVVEIDFINGGRYAAICMPSGWYATQVDADTVDLIKALENGDMFDRNAILSR